MRVRAVRGRGLPTVALALVLTPGILAAAGGGDDDPQPPSATIVIPFHGETEVQAPQGWLIDCGTQITLPEVTVACSPEAITLTAPEYDPDWGTRTITVVQHAGARTLEAGYRVALAPPAPPVLLPTVWPSPADAGGVLLVPLADLGLRCAVCSNARVEAGRVEPAGAASVGTDGTHVVIRPQRATRGMILVTVGVVDDLGQRTRVQLGVSVRPAPDVAAGALHAVLTVPASSGSTLDVGALLWAAAPTALEGARIVGCATPLLGTVACDGLSVRYLPPPVDDPSRALVDQFSFRVVTAAGRELAGSLTLRLDDSARTPSAPLPVAATAHPSAPLGLTAPAPVETTDGGSSGPLAVLSRLVDSLTLSTAPGGTR